MMDAYHYSPRTIDDQFSNDVYKLFIDNIDSRHLYLTAADIKELSEYKDKIDDEINDGKIEFLEKATALYKARLLKADSTIASILSKPFDLKIVESLNFPMDSGGYAIDQKQYMQRWSKFLKFETLQFLATAANLDSTATKASILQQEPAMREKVKISQTRRVDKILQHAEGFESYVCTLFCNAITSCYDPHSDYMPPTEKENFVGAVTGETFSFGLELAENEQGEVMIGQLVPGGPAWKSGELHDEDVLIQLKWENKNPIDLTGASLAEVEDILSKSNHERMQLTVKRANGMQKTVPLIKEKIRQDENFVKSFILSGEKRIGYINLPGFYTEWGDNAGSSCANDVAKEILKMSKEHIDGLILDMRYNGGGSLEEALEMAGIFINEGTICFLKGREGKPKSMRDPNRGTMYDGSLLLMVNGQSASATEVVAGALQDYHRAIIVGSPTYGKATGQIVLPADNALSPATEATYKKTESENGYVKVTIEKIYRPTGKTNQCMGLIPDVVLPDMYDALNYREKINKFCLRPDSVKRALYFSPLPELPLEEIKSKSLTRVSINSNFNAVKTQAVQLGKLSEDQKLSIPLQYEAFMAFEKKEQKEWNELEHVMENSDTTLYKVENNTFDKPQIAGSEYATEINNDWIKTISKSIYIKECYRILQDYEKLKNKQ